MQNTDAARTAKIAVDTACTHRENSEGMCHSILTERTVLPGRLAD